MAKGGTNIKIVSACALVWSFAVSAETVDLDPVSSNAGTRTYTLEVPNLGTINLQYSGSDPRSNYNGSVFQTPHYGLAPLESFTITADDFVITSAVFEVWDLDQNTGWPAETALFNGGNQLTAVGSAIANNQAHIPPNPVFSAAISPDGSGAIQVLSGTPGSAGWAVGGIEITGVAPDTGCSATGGYSRVNDIAATLSGNIACGNSVLNSDQFQELHTAGGRIEEQGANTGDLGSWSVQPDTVNPNNSVVRYTYTVGGTFQYRLFTDGSTYYFCEDGEGDGQTNGRLNTTASLVSSGGNCGF